MTLYDFFANTGAGFLTFNFLDEGEFRWVEYDPLYEKMWKDMAKTFSKREQEKKIQEMVQYIYDRANCLFIYSPLTLYAVNKEVNFVPQKSLFMRLKETSVTERHWSVRGENN